ncbi:hypothetical protein YC2023_034043 [Brassica napus]
MKQKVMFLIMRKPLKGFRNVVHLLPSAETVRAKKKLDKEHHEELKMELTESVVNVVLVETFLAMDQPVADYNTEATGLTAADVEEHVTLHMAYVQVLGITGSRRVEQDCKAAANEVLAIVRGIQSDTFSL